MEEGVNALLSNAQHSLRDSYQACEQRIRRSPTTSVLGAVLAGYCAHRLPLRAIAVAQVRVIAALAPPALLLFGAAKVYEFLQQQGAAREARLHPLQ
jgi:hypothetical protein